MRLRLAAATVAFWVVLAQVPVWGETSADGCAENWTLWREAFSTLKQHAAELRSIRAEAISSEIERAVEDKKGTLSMARVVQAVLSQWRKKIRAAAEKLNQASDHESAALSDLRKCMGRRDFDKAGRSDPDLIERKKLVGSLPKLLLEEAYSQYNRHSSQTTTTTTSDASRAKSSGSRGPSRYGYAPATRYGASATRGYPRYH